MNDLRPIPLPVEVVLPPRATVMADKTALLPPILKIRYVSDRCSGAPTSIVACEKSINVTDKCNAEGHLPMIKLIWGPKVKVRYLWHMN